MFTILIVDDNLFDRECINKLVDWEKLDIQVVAVAENGIEGYYKAIEFKPDFILTDVAMPKMDGLDMTEIIQAELPETLFIFMSCHDEFDFAKAAIDLDVSSYVLKPIDLDELVQAIEKVKKIKIEKMDTLKLQEELKAQIRDSIPILQENLIKDLIHGKFSSMSDIEDRSEFLNMPINNSYIIVLFQVDNYELYYDNISIDQKYIFIYSIRNVVNDTLIKDKLGYSLIQDYSNLCVILFGNWATQEEAFEELMDQCTKCKMLINSSLSMNITIGISNLSNNILDIPYIYQGAEYAVRSKFFSEGNRIITVSEIISSEVRYEFDFMELKKEIEIILDRDVKGDAEKLIDKYYSSNIRYNEGYVKGLCYSILVAIQMHLAVRNENFSSVFDNEYVVWDKLSKFETILDIKQWIINIINAVREHIQRNQANRLQNIVQDIKEIIDRDYHKIQSIQQIADLLYISSGYANNIFKQETGITIGDYLFEKRMEAAKKMLYDPYCRIYEVAERIGYVSKSYFGVVFKEYTGMTPKEYRDKYCR